MSTSNLNKATIALGSNVGQSEQILRQAVDEIARTCGNLIAVSPLYQTVALIAPGTYSSEAPSYLNGVIQIMTDLSGELLLLRLLDIERSYGRNREQEQRWGPRTLDLDVISLGSKVQRSPTLTLPHPECERRSFVLKPLVDIDPQWVHPILNHTAELLLREIEDELYPPKRVERLRAFA